MPIFSEVALAHRVLNINFSTWSKVGRIIFDPCKSYRSKHIIPSLAKNYLLWGFMGPIFNATMDLFSWYTWGLVRWSSRPWKWLAENNNWKTSGFYVQFITASQLFSSFNVMIIGERVFVCVQIEVIFCNSIPTAHVFVSFKHVKVDSMCRLDSDSQQLKLERSWNGINWKVQSSSWLG